ncbi:MAG: GTP-binding protein [Candidatus Hodarchaeota archaeon]
MTPTESPDTGYSLSTYKVIIVGEGGVGKTSLCIRATQNSFPASYRLTIGTGFFTCRLQLDELKHRIALQIWDFGGQKQFASILDAFTRNTTGAILTFDISSISSFVSAQEHWLPFLKRTVAGVPVVLVSTKDDLAAEVPKKEIETLLKNERESNVLKFTKYIQTSAKTGKNVKECLLELAKSIVVQKRTTSL